MKITEYWRSHQDWSAYLGRQGKVISVTTMHAAASDHLAFSPYAYLLVELSASKQRAAETISLMGGVGESFAIADEVIIVLRKIKAESAHDVIVYGLKAIHGKSKA